MSTPFLSIVIPAYNEEHGIGACIDRMRAELSRLATTWELLVVDDGSRDGTVAVVAAIARTDDRIRVLALPHRGKGAAVREGLLAARGEWRFMADADLSMPPDNLPRFFDAITARADEGAVPDVVIASREAPGAERVGEPWTRHVIGRLFNWIVRMFAVPGIQDTQCGYKMFSAAAVQAIVPHLTIDGFAFDVEALFLARRAGLAVREVGITWNCRTDSRVGLGRGAAAFADILRIRWRALRGRYAAVPRADRSGRVAGLACSTWAYILTAIAAAAFGFDLLHMPVQVYDAVSEMLDASGSPSAWASFTASISNAGYMRPLRIAQIKLLFDLSGGNYWLAYRGFHVLLFAACLFLFVRLLRVRTAADLAAAAFALVVLTGLHTFRGTVNEAYPINHFLEMVVCCLLALNLARSRGGVLVDAVAIATFAAAALTLESGLLVWVVAVAAWVAGARGISRGGLAGMTALLAVYVYVRFFYLPTGVPSLIERSSGYIFDVLEPSELLARFGGNPLPFYAYNVATSALSVLFSEPQAGLFLATAAWLDGDVPTRLVLGVVSSVITTAIIAWAAVRMLRDPGSRDHAPLLVVFAAVLAGNAVLSFAYTKNEIMSVAGAFYALAAYAAVRLLLARAGSLGRTATAVLTVAVLVSGTAWTIRSVGVHHVLRTQAFKHRNDWALLPGIWRRSGRWPEDPRLQAVLRQLRNQALALRTPNPGFAADWANDVWGE
jgi:glycosyltransferase involved in cell wall biosynthesis